MSDVLLQGESFWVTRRINQARSFLEAYSSAATARRILTPVWFTFFDKFPLFQRQARSMCSPGYLLAPACVFAATDLKSSRSTPGPSLRLSSGGTRFPRGGRSVPRGSGSVAEKSRRFVFAGCEEINRNCSPVWSFERSRLTLGRSSNA